ncbi:potassium-transporting ATPase subunit KdpB [Fluviispira multicolorata]|uniref:Potassium-transporting ATPase ATP-binding subunit n=1 Tax=Fluviispira multicolorata TaxID=2654512 RepID=A0A833JF28_9BACT|nr:potassium-transporting ATPase subunit KdpB [Fluviispira multicolorata]KAB8033510.1 potassium-transporting ATPase subunit KdpB [Fluviispira multicolorata]
MGGNSLIISNELILSAIKASFTKMNPFKLITNPVIFIVALGALITTLIMITHFFSQDNKEALFSLQISLWLWFTVLFANFAEAIAEGRGKAQAENLRQTRKDTQAKRLNKQSNEYEIVSASTLLKGDKVVIVAGEIIPADGTVIEGMASIDESAITGESAPVIRESGGDRSAVTGGTTVLSDKIVVLVTAEPGKSFLDKMIALVEGAERKKTPNEIALNILLIALTIVFLLSVFTLKPFALFQNLNVSLVVLIALLVCLIPTTIGGLLSAIGIAGMDRVLQRNVLAMSGRAVEAAGDVDVLLLDKTGTITVGNRMASEFIPAEGVTVEELARASLIASSFDDTPEGRSIVKLANELHFHYLIPKNSIAIPFTAETRMSGIDTTTETFRKGSLEAIIGWVRSLGGQVPKCVQENVIKISKLGGTPLAVAKGAQLLGVIYLKDIVKPGISARFMRIRAMGIRTVMITGDNKLTATAIAAEAGVDDFLSEAKPEDKLLLIKSLKKEGRMVAMSGDGTNDAPALAQADVGLSMNTGTQAAREAGNMIDLDSDPTKVIEIVEIGKQLLITRGALTTFSIANDVAKYFAIIPAIFIESVPRFEIFNIMHLETPYSAILSATIFNALIIIILVPLALRGVKYKPRNASSLLRYNLLVFGLGGIILPFIGIKIVDVIINSLNII